MIFNTKNQDETYRLGKNFGKLLKKGDIIAFIGDMGTGKTTFTRGVGAGIGFKGDVSSPTFALVNQYDGDLTLFHFDMYRITSPEDLYSTGFYDYLEQDVVLVIEWSEKITDELPKEIITIKIDRDVFHEEALNKRTFNITSSIEGDDRFENLSY